MYSPYGTTEEYTVYRHGLRALTMDTPVLHLYVGLSTPGLPGLRAHWSKGTLQMLKNPQKIPVQYFALPERYGELKNV